MLCITAVFADTLSQEAANLVSGGAGSVLTGGVMGVFAWYLLTKAIPRLQDRYEASLDKVQAANSDAIKALLVELREARMQAGSQADIDRKMRHEHADRLHAVILSNRAEMLTEFRKLECYKK